MPRGEKVVIQKVGASGAFADWRTVHLLEANKNKSKETFAGYAEGDREMVKMTFRHQSFFPQIEFDKPSYRIKWRDKYFDIREYDDYKYQRRKVVLTVASYEQF